MPLEQNKRNDTLATVDVKPTEGFSFFADRPQQKKQSARSPVGIQRQNKKKQKAGEHIDRYFVSGTRNNDTGM